nr:hypothetical protein CFP56_26706 [Quercus suber]
MSRTKETGWAIGTSLGAVMEVDVLDSGVHSGFQYGAWLRGDPYGRTQKEPVKYGGGENHGSRDGVAGVRLERTRVQSDLPGEKPVVGGNHVPVSLPLGSSSLTRDDAILEAPRQLTATPQEEGKVEGCEEDIPPGFEGQHLKDTIVTEVFDKFEGYKGICECVDKMNPEIISSPSKKPNGPSLDAKRANLFAGSSELGQQQVHLRSFKSHVTHDPQLTDISNHQNIKHASHALGQKWSRVLRSSPGSKEALLPHVV